MNGVVDFGRHLAAINGFGDRIHFLRGDSRQIHLPERVQVVVSDVRGVLPLHSHAVGTLKDARTRFLAEGGQLLPRRDTLICAVVEAAEGYQHIAEAWKAIPSLDLRSGVPLVLNAFYRQRFKPQQVISQAHPWHTLDYLSGPQTPAAAKFQLSIACRGTGHGFGIWFETELTDGIGYSTDRKSEIPSTGTYFYRGSSQFLCTKAKSALLTCVLILWAMIMCGNGKPPYQPLIADQLSISGSQVFMEASSGVVSQEILSGICAGSL
jgi:protein arginine N-methyltransferase 1